MLITLCKQTEIFDNPAFLFDEGDNHNEKVIIFLNLGFYNYSIY